MSQREHRVKLVFTNIKGRTKKYFGRYVGTDPHRFFITGFGGYLSDQGPEPHSVKIDVDANSVITKLGVIVKAH